MLKRPRGGRRQQGMARLVLAMAAVAAMVGAVGGQEPEKRDVVGGLTFLDEVEVTVVNVDVFVRDKDNTAVTGLEREDFRLLVDGVEQPLSNFAAYTENLISELAVQRQEPGPAAAPTPPADAEATEEVYDDAEFAVARLQPVHMVLYVDNENLRPFDRNRVLPQVQRFLRTAMLPHVQVMVVSAERSVRIVQGFTNDPKQVESALRDMRTTYGGRTDKDRTRGRLIADMQRVEDQRNTGNTRTISREAYELEESIRTYGEELSFELGYSISAVREITTSLAGLPGRKVMIHISSGLPMVPARDLISWWGELFQQKSILPMLARFNRGMIYEALASTANAQGVAFYTIDATGLGGVAGASSEYARPVDPLVTSIHAINYQEPLQVLAEMTGGRAILDSNDVSVGLEELREDLFTYYSLGYRLSASGSDTVHRLAVEIPEHPEYRLVYRRTLVEKSVESRAQDAVVSGLVLDIDDNPMAVEVTAEAAEVASENRWILPIEVGFPIESVAMLPEGEEYVGQVVVFLANRNLKGRQSDVQRREFQIRMPAADYEARRSERYVAEFGLLMEEGTHRIVVGVLDPVTRQASYTRLTTDVP